MMDKYINLAEICIAYKEDEVAAQYGGKNDITTGVLFVLDTLELDMPESIVRCKDCKHFADCEEIEGVSWTGFCNYGEFHTDEEDFCSRGERRSE